MMWIQRQWRIVRNLWRRNAVEEGLAAELEFHREMDAAESIRGGMPSDAAHQAAARNLGDVEQVKEECRDALGYRWIEDSVKDLRFGWRTLIRQPGFTIAAVLTLALGIGANTAVFSAVNSVLLQRLPFPDADRLVMIWEDNLDIGMVKDQCTPGDFLDWDENNRVFESMGLVVNFGSDRRNFLLRLGDDVVRIRGRHASSGLFRTLGVDPLLGRTFSADEDFEGSQKTALLSHGLWQRVFSGDRDVIGEMIDVGERYRVIGVMPPEFQFPEDSELWLSANDWMTKGMMRRRDQHSLWVIAKLKPDVGIETAQAEISALQYRASQEEDMWKMASGVQLVPLTDQIIGASTRPALIVLLCAVGFVLLIACANVANLMLARASSRRQEIAVRTALGAGRFRVIRQLLTESLLISLIGGAFGVVIAIWGIDVIQSLRGIDTFRSVRDFRFDRLNNIGIDWSVLAFTLALSIVTGILFGLIPAFQTLRLDVNNELKAESGRGSAGRSSRRFGDSLVIAEVALALVLLIGATQMLMTFVQMQQVDPGLQTEQVMRVEVDLALAGKLYPGDSREITHAIVKKIAALPDVVRVGAVSEIILRPSGWTDTFGIDGRPKLERSELPTADIRTVMPGTFETLGIPLIAGRDITEQDAADTPSAILVNQEFVRRFFSGEDPIGQRLRLRDWHSFPWMEIVGVVGDVRNFDADAEVRPEIYNAYRQSLWTGAELGPMIVIRTQGDPLQLVDAIRYEIEGDNPQGMLVGFQRMKSVLDASASYERFQTVLMGFFAAIALLMSAMGVYGVISYSTAQRTQEIGVRMALGAEPRHIRLMVVGRAATLGTVGVLLGIIASISLSRVIASQLYGFTQTSIGLMSASAAVLLLVTMFASYLPARRAMSVDPSTALRHS